VLATMGLTISDAFRLLMVRVAKEKALPFEPLTPNAVTVRAMKEARRGKVKSFKSVDDLMTELNAKD
jgi:DNA-damage-inducible protein J